MADLDVSLYPRFTALKKLNPGLETWVQRVLRQPILPAVPLTFSADFHWWLVHERPRSTNGRYLLNARRLGQCPVSIFQLPGELYVDLRVRRSRH